jgi:hypothetical protein
MEQYDYVEREDLPIHYKYNCTKDMVCTPNLTLGCKAIYSVHFTGYRYDLTKHYKVLRDVGVYVAWPLTFVLSFL